MIDTWVIVPAYNEADRLDVSAFHAFSKKHDNIAFLFVDDGSTDDTANVVDAICRCNENVFASIRLKDNAGKAEAVRRGILHSLAKQPSFVGYWDADLATPLNAISSFAKLLHRKPQIDLVMGARVQLLGREIQRSPARHYLGRIFATVVSEMLDLNVYDTQCGAKLFRSTSWLKSVFDQPFLASWIFDVEILARMMQVRRAAGLQEVKMCIYEYPLTKWEDIRGSKVGPGAYAVAARDLLRIYKRYFITHHERSRRGVIRGGQTGMKGERSSLRPHDAYEKDREHRSRETSDIDVR